MKFTDEDRLGIQWKNGEVLRVKTQVYADFPAKVQFVGFYIPSSPPRTYETCLRLAEAVLPTIQDLQERLAVSAGYRNEGNNLHDLIFSGRVLLYHEDTLTIAHKASVINMYETKGFDVQFRGPGYLGDQVIAWHHQHDAKAVVP